MAFSSYAWQRGRLMCIVVFFAVALFNNNVVAENSGLVQRDAYTQMGAGDPHDGEAHGAINPPSGSSFVSLPVGRGGDAVGAYWTKHAKNEDATQAFIIIHGRRRDGDKYWNSMHSILSDAVNSGTSGADKNAVIVAPQFFSAKYNKGQYDKNVLAWGDVNAWEAGETAVHPRGTSQSSFDALDAIVNELLNAVYYPAMERITIVGHGGGGQLVQRYATVARANVVNNANVHIRYIHGDPSTCVYFTADRPTVQGATLPSKAQCPSYNAWRYGFEKVTSAAATQKTPKEYFAQYVSRDVVSIVGYDDTNYVGDTTCMAEMQGGQKRRDRNLIWWRYINTLARTDEDLTGFPGAFNSTLPDWSSTHTSFNVQLVVVPGASHSVDEVFRSSLGRAALFQAGSLPTGWRPAAWKDRKLKTKRHRRRTLPAT